MMTRTDAPIAPKGLIVVGVDFRLRAIGHGHDAWSRFTALPRVLQTWDRPPPETPTPLDGCAQIALALGGFGTTGTGLPLGYHDDARWNRREQRFAAEHHRFNLHAGVRIAAADIEGRERLYRYTLRPCFALERLSPPAGRPNCLPGQGGSEPPRDSQTHGADRVSRTRERPDTTSPLPARSLPWRARPELAVPLARRSSPASRRVDAVSFDLIRKEADLEKGCSGSRGSTEHRHRTCFEDRHLRANRACDFPPRAGKHNRAGRHG